MSSAKRAFFLSCLLLFAATVDIAGCNGEAARLRILTYNIRHGEGMDGKINLERIAAVIRSVTPDLVGLQEVDIKTRRSGGVDQAVRLARLAGFSMVDFARAIDFEGGLYGNAILGNFRVTGGFGTALPCSPGREDRVVHGLEIDLPSTPGEAADLLFITTHLDHSRDPTDRLAAVSKIFRLLKQYPGMPAVLVGDLNAEPESEVLKRFRKAWSVAGSRQELLTWPSPSPTRQIDYVLYRPTYRWRVIEVRVLDEVAASDHRPFFAVLELLPAGGRKQ